MAMNHNKSTYIGSSKTQCALFLRMKIIKKTQQRSIAITFKIISKQIMSKHCCHGIRHENEIIFKPNGRIEFVEIERVNL